MFELQNITFSFPGLMPLINNISVKLEKGKIYALMGANGAGKTTIFNVITGFIKPQGGDIFLNKENLTRLKPYKRNLAGVGRTFQDLRLITKLTVRENIILAMQHNPTDHWLNAMLPVNFHRTANEQLEKKTKEIVEQFFLDDVKNSLAAEVSYGQQKLLSLACCWANGATLLLLDEPVAGIQPEYRNQIAILIRQIKEQGKTILLIEHNTEFIDNAADKILFLHEGKISTYENMEALRKDKRVMDAYI